MNAYKISYTEMDAETNRLRRVEVSPGTFGKNGIEAIYTYLRCQFQGQPELLEALETEARTIGSIKRLTLAGITFQADKISVSA